MDFSNLNVEFETWKVPAIESLFGNDCHLRPYEKDIRRRYGMFEKMKNIIESRDGMDRFTRGYEDYGVMVTPDGGVQCKEWAPNARALFLQGEFNNFERMAYKSMDSDMWELYISPRDNGICPIRHMSELRLVVETKDYRTFETISPWAKYVIPRGSGYDLQWLFWHPSNQQITTKPSYSLPRHDRLRIYEAYVGISAERSEMSAYQNFTRNMLPRIRDMGYNCVLLMSLMDQSKYRNMGFPMPNFFSTSSCFGSPEDLRELIKTAHSMGMMVMMDVMHNHAAISGRDGMSLYDGGEGCCFYRGRKESENYARNFDFTKWEVLRFLMSYMRYYLEEFFFDGFRFNGVTPMIYQNKNFGRHYDFNIEDYFGSNTDYHSMVYFMLANDMIHRFYPNAITIAEDYSEFPALCRPISEGGFGFDYRSAANVSELWQKFLSEKRDEEWDLDFLFRTLTKRRKGEKYIAFTESHEQNLFGRTTIGRYLMNRDDMFETRPRSHALDRSMSLHKMIRLITHSLAGESYMNFMGNEFGHPDWIEFPSSSCSDLHKTKRLFQLVDDDNLRYKYLSRFDAAMNKAEEKYGWLRAEPAFVSRKHDSDKVFVFERAGLLFIFNFHPSQSYPDYRVGVEHAGRYHVVLDTDSKYFGGNGRMQSADFNTFASGFDNRPRSLRIFLPSRSAIVMANCDFASQSFHGNSTCCSMQPHFCGSTYGSNVSAAARCTDSSHCFSTTSYDGNRGVLEENHHKRVMYHEDGTSCDRIHHDHGYICSCKQLYSKSAGYKNHCCGYKKEEYTAAKYTSAGEIQDGRRYW